MVQVGTRRALVVRVIGAAAGYFALWAVYRAFKVAQDVTLQRLYIETMEEILKNANKVIIDKAAQGQSKPGASPFASTALRCAW